jgi:hypothetical protein
MYNDKNTAQKGHETAYNGKSTAINGDITAHSDKSSAYDGNSTACNGIKTHKMAKALPILTEAPREITFHHLRQFWLSINKPLAGFRITYPIRNTAFPRAFLHQNILKRKSRKFTNHT